LTLVGHQPLGVIRRFPAARQNGAELAGFLARAQSLPNAINLLRSLRVINSRPVISFRTSGPMSHGNLLENLRQAGVYAGSILKREKLADLPVMLPIRFELAF
jgi:hypothetical protein